MVVEENKVVVIEYTLKNEKGEILESSKDYGPLAYIQGMGNLLQGLENVIAGKKPGDEVSVTLPPAEAYGVYDKELIQKVPKSAFDEIEHLEVGLELHQETEEGIGIVTVTEIAETEVTIDGNHPLADETLHFDVKVLEIREPTEEELEHGHVHGEHGVVHEEDESE